MIMQPKEGFSPLPSYIYQFIIKSLDFCLDNWTTISVETYKFAIHKESGKSLSQIRKEYMDEQE